MDVSHVPKPGILIYTDKTFEIPPKRHIHDNVNVPYGPIRKFITMFKNIHPIYLHF